MVAQFGPDGTRYLLLTQYPFGIDGDVQANRFVAQYNSDLANDLGNLASRVGKLITTEFDGRLPEPAREIEGLEQLMLLAEELPNSAYTHIKYFRLSNAIADALNLVRAANKFFNDTAPWTLPKKGEKEKLGGILYSCCEVLRIVSIILYPVMPRKMRELREALGLSDETLKLDNAQAFFVLQPGTAITIDKPIFPRIGSKNGQAPTVQEVSKPAVQDNLVDISQFAKLELRVAQVLQAERVEGASKLLRLQIDIGAEKRQIVAGVAEHYSPEQITGKKIVVVTNLKPAVIRGVTSNGMLLAAKSGQTLRLVTPDGDLPPGARIS
jgi:methionyl-tRNA synthetase